eukprot:COSAG02_NODE_3305_length_6966_cov_3.711664_2_plen_52_part_00
MMVHLLRNENHQGTLSTSPRLLCHRLVNQCAQRVDNRRVLSQRGSRRFMES